VEKYKPHYKKGDDQYEKKLGCYAANIQKINDMNSKSMGFGETATFGETKFADHCDDDFSALFGRVLIAKRKPPTDLRTDAEEILHQSIERKLTRESSESGSVIETSIESTLSTNSTRAPTSAPSNFPTRFPTGPPSFVTKDWRVGPGALVVNPVFDQGTTQ